MNIIVTGAGRGIGYEVALNLANRGVNRIFAIGRNEIALKKLMESAKTTSSKIIALQCDITSEKNVSEVVSAIEKEVNGIDVLINNAGKLINRPIEELTLSDWQEIYSVNVFGVFNITKALLPLLKTGSLSELQNIKSHIVNISSVGGVQGSVKFKGLSAYSSSKGAVSIMSECFSEELKSFGIHVNCLALGSVQTEMFASAFPGVKAGISSEKMGAWIGAFATSAGEFFNGKVISVSTTTP